MIDARHPALENAEISFNRIRVCPAADVFADSVLHGEVVFEFSPDGTVVTRLIGHQHGVGLNLRLQNRLQGRGVHVVDGA